MSKEKRKAFEIPMTHTDRGFRLGEWQDRYGAKCSIQESSLADEPCIWLGVGEREDKREWAERVQHNTGHVYDPWTSNDRMHLTQEMADALWPMLKHFAETGELPR